MSTANAGLDAYYEAGSPLESTLEGFSHRPEQLDMARRVSDAILTGKHLAIEAGAGTGKTLAYLVPVLLSGRRAIVATATRTLQDQLFHRDLPVLSRAIGRPVRVAQLKGRSNYLCLHRMERLRSFPEGLDRESRRHLGVVQEWSVRTVAGDIAEVAEVAEDAGLWPMVTSTADNCLGSRCPSIEQCHVVAARRRAIECDLVIVNHHLLLADMNLKDDGFGRLLPGAEVAIVDEAHRFPETAQSLFDLTLHAHQVEEVMRDLAEEARVAGVLATPLEAAMRSVSVALAAAMECGVPEGDALPLAATGEAFAACLSSIAEAVDALSTLVAPSGDASPGFARAVERVAETAAVAGRIADWESLSDLAWVQRSRNGFSVHVTPLDSSQQLRALLEAQTCTWIFTSATLAVGEDFSHFSRRLGVRDIETGRIDSPFDYARCARLYLPQGLPPPNSPDYTDRFVAAALPLLRKSRGRAFLLFTSRRALQRAAELLAAGDHGHTLLVQGAAPRSRLIEQFLREDSAVLLGTATFWEGVDIRGSALVVVAIDKLPFASPGDPLMQARLELVRRNGGDGFRDYQLPQAVLALRQGVGRLIRGYGDYGVVMIGDPRLTGRGYGKTFLHSLPPMPVVRSAEDACEFLGVCEAAA